MRKIPERTDSTVIQFLADAAATQPSGTDSLLYQLTHGPFALITIVLIVMWVFMIMPKRKQEKQQKLMLNSMKRGDEVTTIGGIIGKVVDPKEDRVLVKVDESSNTKIWFSRSAIARVTSEDSKAANK
ncbi:MAG TPA: preprotein translocase subunit YajC [Tepidisphaeraceae bacterium]|nr:preprotein translocase subunit YajC [Tepidisphaeraceae bacterium]